MNWRRRHVVCARVQGCEQGGLRTPFLSGIVMWVPLMIQFAEDLNAMVWMAGGLTCSISFAFALEELRALVRAETGGLVQLATSPDTDGAPLMITAASHDSLVCWRRSVYGFAVIWFCFPIMLILGFVLPFGGYISYDHTGWGAEQGERQKQESWDEAIDRRAAMSANDVKFVPFSIEAGGVWGPAAQGFFNECLKLADSDRNVDLYHWSSAKFSSTWYDTLSVLVAKGRAKVSVAASEADWSKRICEMQYADYEDHTVGS